MNTIKKDIITILKAYLNKDYSFNISSDLKDIYDLSTKLSLSPIIGYTLNKTDKYKNNIFDSLMFYTANRYEHQQHYRNLIKDILESNNIDFLYLKGNTLSKYYDEEYLRLSSDIDILVSKDNYELSKDLLVKNTDLKELNYATNEQTLSNRNIFVDIHNKLTNNVELEDKIFEDIDLKHNNHELSNEYKYLFILSHASKHLKECYINLLYLIDLYYINKLDLDRNFIHNKLTQCNLDKFNDINIKTLNVLFNDEQSNEVIDQYIEFLFNFSNNCGVENMVLVGNSEGGKFKYILTRAFPKYPKMCRMYPIVEKYKILLPIYYIKRLFDRKSEGRLSQAIKEIDVNRNVDRNKVKKINELYKNIGLK